jgi:hypothetical protein
MRTFSILSVVMVGSVILAACGSQVQQQVPQQPPAAAQAQPTEPPAPPAAPEPTQAPEPSPEAAAAPAHASVPGDLPEGKGTYLGDQSTITSLNKERAFAGDRFSFGKFERPYNANTMDVYYPFLDIVSGNFYEESTWVYARVTLVGPDANGAFPAKYAVEVDTNRDGHGDMLVIVDHPSSADWSTDGVRVLADRNHDVGGALILKSDSQGNGDGYEAVLFDQGTGDDPDAAWARLSPSDPNSLELAFKASLLQGETKFLAGLWAGTDSLDPSLFDIDDHFTHEQAGEASEVDFPLYYPIKAVAELDNTCRAAVGYVPNGQEPALCSQGQ